MGAALSIGLLKADFLNDDLVGPHGDLPDMFARFFGRSGPVTVETYEVRFGRFPFAGHGHDALVISGSRESVNGRLEWVDRLLQYLAAWPGRTPMVGFCFGHQALAKAFGGRVEPRPDGPNVGARTLRGAPSPGRSRPPTPEGRLLFNHGEQVTSAPRGSLVLAGDENCPTQVVEFRPGILGVQAHPKYTAAYQDALMALNPGVDPRRLAEARERNARGGLTPDAWSRWITAYVREFAPEPGLIGRGSAG